MELARNYLEMMGFSASQTPTSTESINRPTIDEQTRALTKEFVYYFAKNTEPQSPIGVRIRECVDQLSKEHGVVFDDMISKIDLCRTNAVELLLDVARQVFEREEGDFNWGRVTTLLTFAGFIARKLMLDGDEQFLEMFATAFGNYMVTTMISEWIVKQGGWDAFQLTTGPRLLGNFGTVLCLGFGVAAACTYTLMR